MTSKIKVAEHGNRLKGKPTIAGTRTLKEGDTFISLRYPNKPETLAIPPMSIGIVHDEGQEEISICWADCQTARRWRAKVSVEQSMKAASK